MYLKKELYELIRSDERIFDFIQDSSLDGLWYWDLENPENEWMNARFWTVLGYEPDDMPHKSSAWQSIINQDDLKVANENFTRHCENPDYPYDQLVRYTHKNGSTKWIRCRGLAIRDDHGKPIRMLGAHQDVSDLKNREQELVAVKENAEKLKNRYIDLIGNINAGVVVHAADTSVITSNARANELLGLSEEQIRGKVAVDPHWRFIDEENTPIPYADYPVMRISIHKKAIHNQVFGVYRSPDETVWLMVNGFPVLNDSNDLSEIVISFIDITERKQAELLLKEKNEEIAVQNVKLNSANLELQKAKERAETSESRLKSILENLQDAFFQADINGNFTYANSSALSMYGYSENELIGQPASNLYADIEERHRLIEALRKDEKLYDWTGNGKRKDGTSFWVSMNVQFMKDNNGNIIGTEGIVRDITEFKNAEAELIIAKERAVISEERFVKAMNASHDGLFDWNLETNEIYFSPGWKKMLGYEDHELPNDFSVWENLINPEDVAMSWELQRKLITKQIDRFVMEFTMKHKDGHWVDILSRAEAFFNDQGKAVRIVGTHTDISNSKQAEIKLHEINENLIQKNAEIEFNNERLESLLKISQYSSDSVQELLDFALAEAIALTKSKIGYIYFYDETAKQFILNTWSKEVMKECMVLNPETVYDLDKTGCWGDAVRQRRPIIMNEFQEENSAKKGTPEGHVMLRKFLTVPVIIDNVIVAVCGVANKETDYDNSDVRQLTLLMDSVWKISERIAIVKELTAAKEKAEESDRLKSAFLANMSHEIRTPMNGILGFAGLLKQPNLSGEEQQAYIKIIEKSGKRMLNIINDIVDISKIEAGLIKLDIKKSNINEQLEFVYTFFKPEAEAKNIRLFVRTPLSAKDFYINTDQEKVYAILTNLVKNAIKFTKKGNVEFGYRLKMENEVEELEFYVKDTGIGIPKDRQKAIFERFIQADIADTMAYQGAGLGLAISKAYVEMLGGRIRVESEEGTGSTFYFTLPYTKELPTEQDELPLLPSELKNKVRKLKILIAEDDEISDQLIELSILMFSKEILKARTGNEAVQICRDNPDIDLVLMDIRMPGLGGYEATQIIREFNKDVIIIAQTAYATTDDKEKSISSGCNDYIAKPASRTELQNLILKYFGY